MAVSGGGCAFAGAIERIGFQPENGENFRTAGNKPAGADGLLPQTDVPQARVSAYNGVADMIARLQTGLDLADENRALLLNLSGETYAFLVNPQVTGALLDAVQKKKIQLRVPVQSANPTFAAGKLISAYLPLLVCGNLQLSLLKGMPQPFTAAVRFIFPRQAMLTVTETAQKNARPVLTVIRECETANGL